MTDTMSIVLYVPITQLVMLNCSSLYALNRNCSRCAEYVYVPSTYTVFLGNKAILYLTTLQGTMM